LKNNNKTPMVRSMYWSNIDLDVINGQRRVFEYLGIPLNQQNADGIQHGDWMDSVVDEASNDDVIVFCDVDAFPVNYQAYQNAINYAQQGGIFGLAQFSNHKPTEHIYAGPMFMAFSKKNWFELGKPSLKRTKNYDSGEALTAAALSQQKPIHLVRPSSCLEPKWALKDQGVFGIGTFYGECDFFHLFESRKPQHGVVFSQVVNDIVAGRSLQFSLYLSTIKNHGNSQKSFLKRLLGK